jgi:hypothetical protein
MQINKQVHTDRKADARKKILLGGLICKAKLDYLHPQDTTTLYGMLLHAKQLMRQDPTIQKQWRELGKELMTL